MNIAIPTALIGALLLPAPPPAMTPAVIDVTSSERSLVRDHPVAAWPLDPRPEVVAGFDPPEHAWSAGHRGVDLLGSAGAPVRAALGGTVTFAGTIAGRGVVVISHGSSRTTYEPVRATVRTGSLVRTGSSIGTLQTGLSHCAPRICLHWGLIEGDTYGDPLTLLGAGQVRLLPLAS
jgi:murein DD-endopeptidase MepM/ murein hydrolase activator NlpD